MDEVAGTHVAMNETVFVQDGQRSAHLAEPSPQQRLERFLAAVLSGNGKYAINIRQGRHLVRPG